jgi:hypothetical protein
MWEHVKNKLISHSNSINALLERAITLSLLELFLKLDTGGYFMIKRRSKKLILCGLSFEKM